MRRLLVGIVVGASLGAAVTAGAGGLITGLQIKDGSIRWEDLSPGVRAKVNVRADPGAQGARGTDGAAGSSGPQGPAGPQGLPGKDGGFDAPKIKVVEGVPATVPAGGVLDVWAMCPPGSVAIGGGSEGLHLLVAGSAPTYDSKGWRVTLDNIANPVALQGRAYAICVA